MQPNLLPRWQPSLQPSLQLESPFLWPLLSIACLSVDLNMHLNKQFSAHFVVHMPSCLHVLFRVAGPLHSNRGERGNCHLGYVPSGVRGYRHAQVVTIQGGGGLVWPQHTLCPLLLYLWGFGLW